MKFKSLTTLLNQMLAKDKQALARVISFIEDRDKSSRKIIEKIYPKTGNAYVIGVTGPPGAGKSTVADKLVRQIRKEKKRVAVIAIDPTSPFSGGAILGDRIRMQTHWGDRDVYIRSFGTRGKHGGLSQSAKEVVLVLDAAGFDWIIVETAGVGQTELDILKLAHAVCVCLVPESGDGIQVMKAGLMEIADLFVVNKCDRPEADKLVGELVNMVALGKRSGWQTPVIKAQALHDLGIEELFAQLKQFRDYSKLHGDLATRQKIFIKEEVCEIIIDKINMLISEIMKSKQAVSSLELVIKKQNNPYIMSDLILSKIVDKKILK